MKRIVILSLIIIMFAACSKGGHSSPCDGVECSGHGRCESSSGRAVCLCDEGFVPSGTLECLEASDPCAGVECDEWESCINGSCRVMSDRCNKKSDCQGSYECDMESHRCIGPCAKIDCGGHGECREGSAYGSGYGSGSVYQSEIYCDCEEGFIPQTAGGIPVCIDKNCSLECDENSYCDLDAEGSQFCRCAADLCKDIDCGNGGVCSVENGKAVCSCPNGYYDSNAECTAITSQKPGWIGVQWPFTISKSVNDEPDMVYGRIWVENETGCPLSDHPQHSSWKAQLGLKKGTGSAEYPIIAGTWIWADADFNSGYDCADGNQNHEYMIHFPTDKAGDFIYIFRFSLDGGATWWYADKGIGPENSSTPGPNFITSAINYPGKLSESTREIPHTRRHAAAKAEHSRHTTDLLSMFRTEASQSPQTAV